MLLDRKEVLDMLRCPKSGRKLNHVDSRLVVEGDRTEYEIVEDYPVLIDFGSSIYRREDMDDLHSVVDRKPYGRLAAPLRRMVTPPNDATDKNVDYMMNMLFERQNSARVLIIGGGTIGQGMGRFYSDPRVELVAFDVYASPTVQFLADAHSIPLPENSFDAVVVQAVLEHVLEPTTVVSEIHRVLKPDGIVYAETPFLQHVHEGPYDFTRFTESGHRYLFKDFELIRSGECAGAGTQLLWSIDNFFRGLFRSRGLGKAMKVCFFWLQLFDKLIPESYNIDSASGVFFLGRKRLSPIGRAEIVGHYRGAQV